MEGITFFTLHDLISRLNGIEDYPTIGTVELIVCRPRIEERNELTEGYISSDYGLDGDNWKRRGSKSGNALPGAQIALMSTKIIGIVTDDKNRWKLAGNQFFVDFDLSEENLPVGQQIRIGNAVLEISDVPHHGCGKFSRRFGIDATKFINHKDFSGLRLRGVMTKVIESGSVKIGDKIEKITP